MSVFESTSKLKGPRPRDCGCKGIRYCLLCHPDINASTINLDGRQVEDINSNNTINSHGKYYKSQLSTDEKSQIYQFCQHCDTAWLDCPKSDGINGVNGATDVTSRGKSAESVSTSRDDCGFGSSAKAKCPHEMKSRLKFPGIHIAEEFITAEEEQNLDALISQTNFVNSQSGRRKQDFGPKVNFKKRKLKLANFSGLPSYSKFLYERMTSLLILADFKPVEMCNLEYTEARGSHIDPHFDDFWLWGDRLVTVNLLSDSYLTFTSDSHPKAKVRVPMPRRSLLVVFGPARREWKHSVAREDIMCRRVAMTFRELTPEFQEAGTRQDEGNQLLEVALTFEGQAIAS